VAAEQHATDAVLPRRARRAPLASPLTHASPWRRRQDHSTASSALPCPPSSLLQRYGTAQAPCSSPRRRRVSPRNVDTTWTPLLSAALRGDKKHHTASFASLLTHSLALSPSPFFSTDTNHGRRYRRASPAIETFPSKSKPTKSLTASPSYTPCKESRRDARDRRRRPQLRPPRPLLVDQARDGHRPPFVVIVVPSSSPHRSLSHGHLLFFLGARNRRCHPRRDSPPSRAVLASRKKTQARYPFASAHGPRDGPLPAPCI
jgi:hypothetical protein